MTGAWGETPSWGESVLCDSPWKAGLRECQLPYGHTGNHRSCEVSWANLDDDDDDWPVTQVTI